MCFMLQLKENITPKPPSKEKKVHLMQEIALELSIPWDSRSFEERMSNPSAAEQVFFLCLLLYKQWKENWNARLLL